MILATGSLPGFERGKVSLKGVNHDLLDRCTVGCAVEATMKLARKASGSWNHPLDFALRLCCSGLLLACFHVLEYAPGNLGSQEPRNRN